MYAALLTVLIALTSSAFSLKLYAPPSRRIELNKKLKDEVPGINYISRGYNIMFGNPHTTGNVDLGISGVIFDLINCSNGHTFNGNPVPNGVSILSSPTCSEKFTYNAITGANSYSSSLTQSTSFSVKGWGAAFSASSDYQSVYEKTTTSSSVFTSSYTQCACYSASLNAPYDLPSFSYNFQQTILNMPLFYDQTNATNAQFFYDFFTNYFGTHYMTQSTLGGIFGTLSSMDAFSYSTYSSSNLEIDVSASYSTLGSSAASSSMTQTQQSEAQSFDSITDSKEVFNIGGNLPENNITLWQETLLQNPSPIYYKFDVIPHLLTSYYFPEIITIGQKQSALQSALNAYCELLSTNDTFGKIDCEGYPPDPSIPGKSIVQGFYSSNIDGEPKNPYNSAYSCNDGYSPISYSRYFDSNAYESWDAFYCLNETMFKGNNKKDKLHYFGGLYQRCENQAENAGQCNIENYFTNDCTCPDGYQTTSVSDGWMSASDAKSGCPVINGLVVGHVFLCYNESVALDQTIFAGMYSTTTSASGCGTGIVNSYTKTTSCHAGFTPYKVGTQCCWDSGWATSGPCAGTESTFMCLNNIYAVGL